MAVRIKAPPRFTTEAFDFEGERRLRPTKAEVVLESHNGVTRSGGRSNAQPRALTSMRGDADDYPFHTERGHLVALDFGAADTADNLVPMTRAFNGTAWRALERELASLATLHGEVAVTVWVQYEYPPAYSRDPRIPTWFEVDAVYAGRKLFGSMQLPNVTRSWQFAHAPDAGAVLREADADFERAYLQAVADLPGAWRLEDENFVPAGIRNHALNVPANVGDRPYAVLDWMHFRGRLDAWKDYTLGNCTGFTENQRMMVITVNRMRNGGLLESDDPQDFASTGGNFSNRLQPGSSDLAPEVDHIIPESRNGSNAFSNAQLVSRTYNNWKRNKASVDSGSRQYEAKLDAYEERWGTYKKYH